MRLWCVRCDVWDEMCEIWCVRCDVICLRWYYLFVCLHWYTDDVTSLALDVLLPLDQRMSEYRHWARWWFIGFVGKDERARPRAVQHTLSWKAYDEELLLCFCFMCFNYLCVWVYIYFLICLCGLFVVCRYVKLCVHCFFVCCFVLRCVSDLRHIYI